MTGPTLLVLAAGLGRRYGGLKQIDRFGPSGETIMDYALHDALAAGFARVVFIIRHHLESEFRALVGSKYERRVAVDYVFQELEQLPPGFAVSRAPLLWNDEYHLDHIFRNVSSICVSNRRLEFEHRFDRGSKFGWRRYLKPQSLV